MDMMPWNCRVKYRQRAKDLTPERVVVLGELHRFSLENSHPPSIRELMSRLALRSPSTVHAHLENLERQGLVRRESRRARCWTLTQGGRSLVETQSRAA